jgi:hypothetical protein
MDKSGESIPMGRQLPFVFKTIVYFILVYSILGLSFFLFVLFYQLFDRNFLLEWKYKGFDSVTIIIYLMLQAVLHGGLLLSAIQLFKLKKTGFFIFAISYLVLTILSFFMYYESGWISAVIGIIVLAILIIYLKILT